MNIFLEGALRANADDLLAYFERRVQPRDDAADLLGETMLQAWRREDTAPKEPTEARMWLFGIARNNLANHRRSRRRRLALANRLRDHLPAAATPADEDALAIRDAVARLNPEHRELIMLVHWDGFSITEAATLLDLNPSTARGRYATAKAELRDSLIPLPQHQPISTA